MQIIVVYFACNSDCRADSRRVLPSCSSTIFFRPTLNCSDSRSYDTCAFSELTFAALNCSWLLYACIQ